MINSAQIIDEAFTLSLSLSLLKLNQKKNSLKFLPFVCRGDFFVREER